MNQDDISFEHLCEMFNYTPKGRPLTTAEAAEFLQRRKNTLEIDRIKGVGPRFFKSDGTRGVRYAEPDLLKWLAAGVRQSTSESKSYLLSRSVQAAAI